MKPNVLEDHCQKNYPGPIENVEHLCDESDQYLKGTGTKGFETTVEDMYLKDRIKERIDFTFASEELWKFLYNKYGGSEIKRFFVK